MMPAGTPVQVRLPDHQIGKLDDYRRTRQNPPTRAQAAREIIERALGDHMPSHAAEAEGAR